MRLPKPETRTAMKHLHPQPSAIDHQPSATPRRKQTRQTQVFWWVREWRCRHPLPVIAIESIPYIYRRAPFGLRATPADDSTAAARSVRTE